MTWENIDNKAEYKTKASGITVSTNAVSKLNPLGLGYVPTIPVKGKAGSITYAAIADSIITTTKKKTDKEISHDTANALNTLSEIFDKKKIEEKQEYVNILSQVGYRLIGDIAGHKENELYKKAEKARKENNSILAEKYEKRAKEMERKRKQPNRHARNHGSLSIQRSRNRNDKRTDRSRIERPPAKRTGKNQRPGSP